MSSLSMPYFCLLYLGVVFMSLFFIVSLQDVGLFSIRLESSLSSSLVWLSSLNKSLVEISEIFSLFSSSFNLWFNGRYFNQRLFLPFSQLKLRTLKSLFWFLSALDHHHLYLMAFRITWELLPLFFILYL